VVGSGFCNGFNGGFLGGKKNWLAADLKKNRAVGAKHSGGKSGSKADNLMSECFALPRV